MLAVSADVAMMIPDFSAGPWGSANSLSLDSEQLAAHAKRAKEATEKLLKSDEMQSRFQDALKERSSEHDPAAPDSSKSDALHALTEATRQAADGTSGNNTSPDDSSTASSGLPDAREQDQSHAEKQNPMREMLLGQRADKKARNVFTGQLCYPEQGFVSMA